MQIPFHKPYITDEEINAVIDSLKNFWITMGEKTIKFEDNFKEYIGVNNAISVNSCTAALHLSLKSIDLKENDEVILPAITFAATAEVVRYFNAKPVFVDVEKETHNIDIDNILQKISDKTKAVIPVHYAGQPADMDEILKISKNNNMFVIEDAAHSLPAWYRGKKIGTIGDITCFSFYATKTLTTGEGGMITTENDIWAEKMRTLRLHGISNDAWNRYSNDGDWKYDVVDAGYKYNSTDINSAIGIEQLNKLEYLWRERKRIAKRYNSAFEKEEGITVYNIKNDRDSAWHLYPIKLNIEALNIDRDCFIVEMKNRGVGTSVHFIPLYRFSYYKNMGYSKDDFPESEWLFERILSLPIYPGMKDCEIDYVIENVMDIIKTNWR
ncbi:MAG: DegT/DnrJ/EryC1/StrS family aminotransferase [Spirochaetota bacterium]|nr:DegT/DnrJ/EryC1/StrS family aminotransferase [Spirochaetota bacterium]